MCISSRAVSAVERVSTGPKLDEIRQGEWLAAADVLIEALLDWSVDVVFGLTRDGINGLMESLYTRNDLIRFVQVRHKQSDAFMACG